MIMGISMKELKKNRITPAEKWMLERIDGVRPRKLINGNVDWCDKDGVWLFQQDLINGRWFASNEYIIEVLEDEFGLNYSEIEELLTNILYDYTDNGKLKIVFY